MRFARRPRAGRFRSACFLNNTYFYTLVELFLSEARTLVDNNDDDDGAAPNDDIVKCTEKFY